MDIKNKLKSLLEINGFKSISFHNVDNQLTSVFKKKNGNKVFDLGLFYTPQDDLIIFQFYHRFENTYQNPKIDFYEVINTFNSQSILGNLLVQNEKENYFISYKSNYFILKESFMNHEKDFVLFLKTSFDMAVLFEKRIMN